MDTGLIHSCCFICNGRGRYHSMFSKSTLPFAQMVSYVNSSPSMNSSTLTSATCRSSGSTVDSSSGPSIR